MNIYIGHASSFPYQERLYIPLEESHLFDGHTIVLPHSSSDELFDSKTFLSNVCDLFIAEVSTASTGLGIELGWADQFDVPIVCVHTQDTTPSGALTAVTNTIKSYDNEDELIQIIETALDTNC